MNPDSKRITITNPRQVAGSYYWLPGMTIPAGGSIEIDYDPRERTAGVHRTQLMNDLDANLVRIVEQPAVVIPAGLPADGAIAQMLRDQPVKRADGPNIQQPVTINLNDKLGWKPLQATVQSEAPAIDLEAARAKTIGANAMPANQDFPFGMPPELVKAKYLAAKAAEKKAIEDAAVAKAMAELEATKAADKPKPKRKRRTKAEIEADKAAKAAQP